jgi:hypothetical protein
LLLRTAVLGMLLGTAATLAVVLRGSTPAVPASPFVNAEAAELRAERLNPAPFSFPFASPPPPNSPSAVPVTFGQPTIAGIQGTGFEPDLRLDPSNSQRMYASVPGTLSSNDSWIWHSRDAGKTFKWITASHPKVGKPVPCAGGGDTELAVDGAGRVYFNDLTLANFSIGRSDDQGVTFAQCNNTGVLSTLVDRQWYAIDGDPTALGPSGATANSLYLASNNVGQGAPQCPVSGAGNNVLVVYRSVPGPLAGLQFLPANMVSAAGTCDEGIMGNVEVSPVATTKGEVGQAPLAQAVKHVYVIHDDASFSKIRIGRCFPVAVGAPTVNTSDPSGLRCNDLVVSDLGDSSQVRTGANFPSLAIDNVGTLYAVWQQAPVDAGGNVGNTSLRYSYSTDEGATWSTPVTIPTPGLMNSVMTWAAAGDDGLVDITFYGTPAAVTGPPYDPLACATSGAIPPPTPHGGPDFVNGVWSLYMVQTRNAHDAGGVVFTTPVVAGEHHNHRGTVASVMGGLCGDRTSLGDFFKFRIGTQGEANIIYSDSNNSSGIGHTMFVRQNGGPGLFTGVPVSGDPIQLNSVTDPAGDGVRELDSLVSANLANLDILNSTFSKPNPAACHPVNTPCYRVQMQVSNLSLAAPTAVAPDVNIVWLTQWLTPSHPNCVSAAAGCARGGRNFHVYAESDPVNGFRCFFGEASIQALGGGVTFTYPPVFLSGQITAAGACNSATGPNGTITIEVPIGSVSLEAGVGPLNVNRLFSVTASTMTLAGASDSVPALGLPPDVIDVARGYDADFTPTAVAVRSFTAKRGKQMVTLRWRTGSEAGLAGFNLYRQRGKARVRLNRSLVGAAGGVGGHAYAWRVRMPSGAPGARFWLQWVRSDGTRAWYGPARS